MKKSKLYYFVVYFLPLVLLYFVFISTDFYIPKRKKIENQKELATAIVNEVIKLASNKDTLYLIIENHSVTCGNETDNRSQFTKKIQALKYAIRTRYNFDKENSFEQVYKNNNKNIVTGSSSSGGEGCYCFTSPIVYFDYEKIKEKNVYEVKYNSISEDEVDISIINYSNNQEVQSFTLVLENYNWILD